MRLEICQELVWDIIINIDLHPFFVHFPISLYFLAFLLELLKAKLNWIHRNTPLLVFVIASIFTIPSSFTGNSAEVSAGKIIGIYELLSSHESIATFMTTLGIIFSFFLIYIHLKFPFKNIKNLRISIFFLMALMVLYTGLLGGKLVKEFGAGVDIKLEQIN